MMDRAGLAGPDGPTHHGTFDIGYLRIFPNMVCLAPGDARDLTRMLDFALHHSSPCGVRYPKDTAVEISRPEQPIELGKSETLGWGRDAIILCYGTLLNECIGAADILREQQIDVGIVNMRFAKPLDRDVIRRALIEAPVVLTVEEGALLGGFGSAVLEAAADMHLDVRRLHRLGIPDQFVEHGDRAELLADLRLDRRGIAQTVTECLDHAQLWADVSRE